MTHTDYSFMTNDELISAAYLLTDPTPMEIELAQRLDAAEDELRDELECGPDDEVGANLEEAFAEAERRMAAPDRRRVRVEGGRRGND